MKFDYNKVKMIDIMHTVVAMSNDEDLQKLSRFDWTQDQKLEYFANMNHEQMALKLGKICF